MPLDFPNSPTLNQIYTSGAAAWSWDGAKWVNGTTGGGGGGSGSGPTDVTATYTLSGGIAITDNLSMLNSSSALAMTIANGTVVKDLVIHKIGTGTATVSGTIEGGSLSFSLLGKPNGATARLRWLPSLSTWIIL